MAIYHLSAKIVSRKGGGSVIAAAAYRSATRLHEVANGVIHDYTRKRGVDHAEILAPPWAPEWVYDRQAVWAAVERAERRKDAQLARELEVALPSELEAPQQVELVRDYVTGELVALGMIADAAIHREDVRNPHFHLLLTTRVITTAGFGAKEPLWSEVESLLRWRRAWADIANAHLGQAGYARRIDERTLAAQGITRAPGQKIGVSKGRQPSQGLSFIPESR
jgi:ATP-dependent exoDNAse (exonuclease V) alpha subunit